MSTRPLIWVLKGARAGDTAQAMELALQLGGRVEAKQMLFNRLHIIPNFLLGGRTRHLQTTARNLLHVPWPDIVVATGRRTAPVAVWIKQQSRGKTKLVQIGRPRMALSAFDVVVTTPQYGLPNAPNVLQSLLPFASPKSVESEMLNHFRELWQNLPRPWILAVIGGPKFPLRLDAKTLSEFGAALHWRAAALGGSVILLDSPRSPEQALAQISEQLNAPSWTFERGHGPNPYQAALQLCDELVVTGDSVSMVSEMLATGKPTSIFRLELSPVALGWSAQKGSGKFLAAHGILHPPRDVDGFMQRLLDQGLIGDFANNIDPRADARECLSPQVTIDAIKQVLKI